jgi:pSer/pThr/pTyr-binding forkhead associated (FHA) protein
MKVSLVVAAGVHQGKAIPIPGVQLLIGRDPDCQLRPASPAISKKHCLVSVRDGRVFVKDLGSTNGTFVNDVQLSGETEVESGDRVRLGPLDFSVQIVPPEDRPDNTPLPDTLKALPSGGRLSDGLGIKPVPPSSKAGTPMPMPKAHNNPVPPKSTGVTPGTGVQKTLDSETKPGVTETKPAVPAPKLPSRSDDPDALAAALLADGDDDPPPIPEGSTVMELPAADLERLQTTGKPGGPPSSGTKKPVPSAADSSNAANEILRKYLQGKKKS